MQIYDSIIFIKDNVFEISEWTQWEIISNGQAM